MNKVVHRLAIVLLGILLSGGCATRALIESPTELDLSTASTASAEPPVTPSTSARDSKLPSQQKGEVFEQQLRDHGYSAADAQEIRDNLNAMDPNVRALVTGMVLALSQDKDDQRTPSRIMPAEQVEPSGQVTRQEPSPEADQADQSVRDPVATAAVVTPQAGLAAEAGLLDQTADGASVGNVDSDGAATVQSGDAASGNPAPGEPPMEPTRQARSGPSSASLVHRGEGQAVTVSVPESTAVAGSSSRTVRDNLDRPSEQELAVVRPVTATQVQEQVAAVSDDRSDHLQAAASLENASPVPDLQGLDQSSEHWRKQLRQTVTRLRRQLRDEPPEDADELARLQMYLSLLYLVAENQDEAMEVLQDFGDEELEFWRQTVMGLGILLDPDELPRFRLRVDSATNHLRQGVSSLSELGPLRLKNLALCSKVTGFGDFDEFPSYAFQPGQPVILYVEVENFNVEQHQPLQQDSDRFARRRSNATAQIPVFQTELHGRYEILDINQRPIASRVLPVDRNQCRNRRQDYFIPYTFYLPQKIAPGHYTLELTIEDKKGDKFGNAVVDFQVR